MWLCMRSLTTMERMIYYAYRSRGSTLLARLAVTTKFKVRMFLEGRQIPGGDLPTPPSLTANVPKS
jgi:hypothetical protein